MVTTETRTLDPQIMSEPQDALLKTRVRELLRQVGSGKMSNSAYDTAWIARLGDMDRDLSNRALSWLSEHQLADGSWGASKPYCYHDRLVSTLAAMIALTHQGRRVQDGLQIERGLAALELITGGATGNLQANQNSATVGFEMIVPTLVAEAEALGLIKRQGDRILGRLSRQRDAKMAKLAGIKISRFITASHSAEMTGQDRTALLDIDRLQEMNGSVGNSPSATAHFALYGRPGDEQALGYLRSLMNEGDGGVPTLSPVEIFERIWVLWNLSLTGLTKTDAQIEAACLPHLEYIQKYWDPQHGLGFSKSFTVKDGDDTGVGFEILSRFGKKPELDAVLSYEEAGWFRCFELERDPSIDVNVHVLGALRQAGYEYGHSAVRKIISFIRAMRQPEGYWLDKWNLSPYYTTAHVSILCRDYADDLSEESLSWILNTQKADGSWGFYGFSTAEETAYCVQALVVDQRRGQKEARFAIQRARQWLQEHCDAPYPPLWIDKSLYCPESIVKATILSALIMAEE